MRLARACLPLLLGAGAALLASAFVPPPGTGVCRQCRATTADSSSGRGRHRMLAEGGGDDGGASDLSDDSEAREEALVTTEEFFSELKARGGAKTAAEGAAGVTDKQLYRELNKRRDIMLESELYGEIQNRNTTTPQRNMTNTLPDPERTPNEVIMLLLEALRTNDEPYQDHGIEVFYRFTSPSSVTYEFELERVASYIKSSKYALLTRWDAINYPRPLDLSISGERAYQLLRLRDSEANCWQVVSFSLSKHQDCWLLDSVIVKSK